MNIWRELEKWSMGQSADLPPKVQRWIELYANKDWIKKMESLLAATKTAVVHQGESYIRPRVVFYSLRELHLPVLLPIAKTLSKQNWAKKIQIGFASPLYKAGVEAMPEEGLKPETIEKLKNEGWTYLGHEKPKTPYDVVVIADACCDRIEGWGPTVCVGHGTISKNIYFIDSPLARRESFHTALCVPGPWYVNSFKGAVKTNIIPTGFPKMDDLANDYSQLKETLFKNSNFKSTRQTILFAPTYNLELTSMAILAEEWARLDRNKYQVLVKLHGATDPQLVNLYKKLSSLMPGFMHFVDDQNLAPYLTLSDILISDVSSAYVEGLAFDIPVIVVDNPQMYSFSGYNPEAVEYKVREAAYRIKNGNELQSTLIRIEQGDDLKAIRNQYAKELFPEIDGKNSYRVCKVIQEVLEKTMVKSPSQSIDVIVPANSNYEVVRRNLSKMQFNANVYVEDRLAIEEVENAFFLGDLKTSKRFVFLNGMHEYSLHWDEIYDLCLYYNPNVEILGPLFDEGDSCIHQDYVRVLNKRVSGDYELKRWFFKYSQFSFCAPVNHLSIDGMIVNSSKTNAEIREIIQGLVGGGNVSNAHICIGQFGLEIKEQKSTQTLNHENSQLFTVGGKS